MGPIKAAGKYRQEGKTYVVQDGDIIHFQFSEYFLVRSFGGFQETNLTFKMLRQRSRFDKRVEIDLTKRDVWWVKC